MFIYFAIVCLSLLSLFSLFICSVKARSKSSGQLYVCANLLSWYHVHDESIIHVCDNQQ